MEWDLFSGERGPFSVGRSPFWSRVRFQWIGMFSVEYGPLSSKAGSVVSGVGSVFSGVVRFKRNRACFQWSGIRFRWSGIRCQCSDYISIDCAAYCEQNRHHLWRIHQTAARSCSRPAHCTVHTVLPSPLRPSPSLLHGRRRPLLPLPPGHRTHLMK